MNRLGLHTTGYSTVHGSELKLFSDTDEILQTLVSQVDAARHSVLMEFYIWNEGGRADEVVESVIRAAQRGVDCRLLVDCLGARPWWKSDQPRRLRQAGVKLRQALPVGIFRTLIGRTDLRLHRKIVVIDGQLAWTGSMNLVDPRYFKQNAGVGEWVDAMVLVRGTAILPLGATLLADWSLETRENPVDLIRAAGLHQVERLGSADVQVIPSGPGESRDGLLQMVLALINSAETELVLTTPYLVPDDSLLRALRGAAGRGVDVSIILPEKVDSLLTRYASRSYYQDLLEMGAKLYLYKGGLLHTKSIMVDGQSSMFGTVNMDMRSFWLNYEVAMFVYDPAFAVDLRQLQESYLADSQQLTEAEWTQRGRRERFVEDALRLASPLL